MRIRNNDQCYAEKLFTAERFCGQDSVIMANIFYIICGLYKGRFKGTAKEDQLIYDGVRPFFRKIRQSLVRQSFLLTPASCK